MSHAADRSIDAPADAKLTVRKRHWRRALAIALAVIIIALAAGRWALPGIVRDHVNVIIDRSPLYSGQIGDVELHLWRGAYSIRDVKLRKTTGNVPVPFFSAKRVDFSVQWEALRHGEMVGSVIFHQPQMNFVDGADAAEDQTGEGPWLQVIRDLFPLRINRAVVENGSVHFRTFVSDPPVDVYLNDVNGRIENLTNIRGEMAPLITTVHVRAKAMDQANVLMEMKLDPFSYQPTFKLALQLIGLDVTRTNDLVRTYSGVDFTHGWFDLVVELDAVEGLVTGYVKPLYRDLQVLDLDKDLRTNNPLTFIWEGLVEGATELLKNQPRDQFGTLIPLSGRLDAPRADILATVGNILRNAFIRAYLPRLERADESYAGVAFEPAQPLANIPIQSPGTHDPDPMLLTPSAPAADPLKEASP